MGYRLRASTWAVGGVCLLGLACTRLDTPLPAAGRGPDVRLVTQVALQEPESLYLASPRVMAFSDAGDFWVADGYHERVVRYNRQGAPVAVVGRKGSGPGEFRAVGMILPLGDGRVAIADNGLRRLSFFDQASDTLLSAVSYNGITYHGQDDAGGIWLGDLNMERRTGIARYVEGDSTIAYLVSVPQEYEFGGPLAGIYNGVAVTAWVDTLLVAFAGTDRILILDSLGRLRDTVVVPKRNRRGIPPDVKGLFGPESQLSPPEMFGVLSEFYALHRLPGGRVLAAHRDATIDGRVISATLYVTILSRDLKTACVDASIPSTGDAPVVAAFRDDTVFVLDQRADSADHLTSTLLGYVVDDTTCEWQPTQH